MYYFIEHDYNEDVKKCRSKYKLQITLCQKSNQNAKKWMYMNVERDDDIRGYDVDQMVIKSAHLLADIREEGR